MSRFSFHRILTKPELQREKTRDYTRVVLIQVVIIVTGLTLTGPLLEDPTSPLSQFIITIFSLFGAVYAFLLWDMLRNFTSNNLLISIIFFTLVGLVITGVLVEFPYYTILSITNRQVYLLIIHGLLFPIELIVIAYAIRDIFTGGFLTPDKLWGAACVFLMTGISFGSMYDLLTTAYPGSMGINPGLGLPNYAECVTFSFSILGGVDSNLETTRLIRSVSIIEAVWGNLFALLIIGKLLSLPKAENPENKTDI